MSNIPVLSGALDTLEQKIYSSLHRDNSLVAHNIFNQEAFAQDPKYALLFDPQTSGGLLASVPESEAEICLARLRESGYSQAKAIGRVSKLDAVQPAIILQ